MRGSETSISSGRRIGSQKKMITTEVVLEKEDKKDKTDDMLDELDDQAESKESITKAMVTPQINLNNYMVYVTKDM